MAQGRQGGLPHGDHHPEEPRGPVQATGQVRGRGDPGGLRPENEVIISSLLCSVYIVHLCRKDALDAAGKGKGGSRGERIRSSSKERRRGSRESLTDSVHFEGDDNPGIKTKIFHALGLNS